MIKITYDVLLNGNFMGLPHVVVREMY